MLLCGSFAIIDEWVNVIRCRGRQIIVHCGGCCGRVAMLLQACRQFSGIIIRAVFKLGHALENFINFYFLCELSTAHRWLMILQPSSSGLTFSAADFMMTNFSLRWSIWSSMGRALMLSDRSCVFLVQKFIGFMFCREESSGCGCCH